MAGFWSNLVNAATPTMVRGAQQGYDSALRKAMMEREIQAQDEAMRNRIDLMSEAERRAAEDEQRRRDESPVAFTTRGGVPVTQYMLQSQPYLAELAEPPSPGSPEYLVEIPGFGKMPANVGYHYLNGGGSLAWGGGGAGGAGGSPISILDSGRLMENIPTMLGGTPNEFPSLLEDDTGRILDAGRDYIGTQWEQLTAMGLDVPFQRDVEALISAGANPAEAQDYVAGLYGLTGYPADLNSIQLDYRSGGDRGYQIPQVSVEPSGARKFLGQFPGLRGMMEQNVDLVDALDSGQAAPLVNSLAEKDDKWIGRWARERKLTKSELRKVMEFVNEARASGGAPVDAAPSGLFDGYSDDQLKEAISKVGKRYGN